MVIDLPRIWFPWTETVIMGSNRLFIVADMTVPSVRHSRRLVEAVESRVGKQVPAKIIINRMDQRKNNGGGLNMSDVEGAIGEHMAGGIPNNYMLVREAVDRGVPLEVIDPKNNVTEALSKIILSNEAEEELESKKSKGLFQISKILPLRKAG